MQAITCRSSGTSHCTPIAARRTCCLGLAGGGLGRVGDEIREHDAARRELGPRGQPRSCWKVQWPAARRPMLVVGHQSVLGQVLGQLLRIEGGQCPVPKDAVWWLRTRERDGEVQVQLAAVQPPDFV